YVIKKPFRGISEWKSHLPLLGVCHLWRDMLFHRIYRHAFINYLSPDGSSESRDVPRTNIDLIVACGSDFYDAMDFLISRYLSKGGEWPSVFRNSFSPDTLERYRVLGKRFVKCLIDVRYLRFGNQDMRVIPHTIVHLSSALTHLRIDFSGVSVDYFPAVISESLENLTLFELPDTFSMSHFAHHDQTGHIYFNNLIWLTLKYRRTDIEYDQTIFSQISNTKRHLYYKIHAPKLKVLKLEHITPHCDMLYSMGGLCLEMFYITGSIQCAEYLSSQKFDVRGFFEIRLSNDTVRHDEQFYTTTNHYFSQSMLKRILGLGIGRLHDDLRMDLLRWSQLNNLEITTSVSVATLLRLVSHLYNLSNLHVYNVTTNEAMDMLFDNGMRGLTRFGPKSTKLNSINIKRRATYDAVSDSQMVQLVRFLMLNTPSLQKLGVQDEIITKVKFLVILNSQRYPHLSFMRVFSAWPH
ncbi:hypothetical protein GGI15_003232, partial [Coemansia interrupta]